MTKSIISLSLFFITTNLYPMLTIHETLNGQEITQQSAQYLDTLLDKTFNKIKITFKELPQDVRFKVLLSCGEAKPLLLLSILPQDMIIKTVTLMLDLDQISTARFCEMPLKNSLNEIYTSYQQSTALSTISPQ